MRNSRSFATLPCLYGPMLLFEGATLATLCSVTGNAGGILLTDEFGPTHDNLIAGKRIVPELIQSDFKAENIVEQIERLLPDGTPRQSMMKELARIRVLLAKPSHVGAIDRVAEITLGMIPVS